MFRKIHSVIRKIPHGKVSSYGAVARAAGFPGAARQVVWALHTANDLPWHRVVGAKGVIKCVGEAAMEQRFRLEAEGVVFLGTRVDMKRHEHKFGRAKKKRR
jgi:methylated-DNA-protein-cysteine methyltransferase related protein